MRKALDVRYVNERSLLLDCEILLKTIPYVLLRKGIHTGVVLARSAERRTL